MEVSILSSVADLLNYALKLDIDGQLYYDFSEHSYNRLKFLIHEDSSVQHALDKSLVVAKVFGPSYLVPADVVHRAAWGD